MDGLLYYLPGLNNAVHANDLRERGIDYAFEPGEANGSLRFTARNCAQGPDGKAGVVLGDHKHTTETRIGYYPENQRALKIPGKDAWVICWTDKTPPPPGAFLRPTMLPGHAVKLGDGQEWIIPVARGLNANDDGLSAYNALPHATTLDEDGEWMPGEVVPGYRELWALAEKWWKPFWEELRSVLKDVADDDSDDPGEQVISFSFAEISDAALLALRTNYRLGKAEVALLGLFNSQVTTEIMQALVDWPTMLEWIKKKLPEGESMKSGG